MRIAPDAFLAGHELPQRWQGRACFVLLGTGFGAGEHFLAAWQAWRNDPQRCENLVWIAIEPHPITRDELATAQRATPWPETAAALRCAWPALTRNLHRLAFDSGRVQLLLALGDVRAWLPELVAAVDAFDLDDVACDGRVCKALGRLAASEATLLAPNADRALRAHLTTAGFQVQPCAVAGADRGLLRARFAPSFAPRRARSREAPSTPTDRHALIIGAGLAGCAAAWALAEHGWRSTLLERHPQIASEASGNPAGLFHGSVNSQDGVHARFNRAAALAAGDAVRIAIRQHGVAGSTDGLLRLETRLTVEAMRAMLQRLGLPPDYVQALSADAASARAAMALQQPAWFYPSGGWVHPGGLARSFLERAAPRVGVRHGSTVHAVRRITSGWCLIDANGVRIAEAQTLVLANAGDALRLLGEPGWPIEPVRGQISLMRAATLGIVLPRIPVAGAGYLLPEVDAEMIFGATAQPNDADASVRLGDHRFNLSQLERLTGRRLDVRAEELRGRTGWRSTSRDRLPLIGAVPDTGSEPTTRLDQPRFVPRLPGLYVFTALGSRGITWSALGAQVLASCITGAPVPLEASLLDAIDPARFISRRARAR